ncbi:MAG: haloalkane dehalogenase [Ilumatobacter sp.]|uniref:haloalkane dehalogenase n=1 Tax=Ilumatobacter sp. TaxID=1967498 RepID=UPI0026309AB7|nr:haloalkane dehalogenase [Ilumatobacter sp.]MDJ0767367.1 haloalkane dehalogenase [Ilumatobacter sp.]
MAPAPSSAFPYESRFVDVLGSRMHYVEEGRGEPILFVHGNPTSSYLWRNVIPYAAPHGRAIALDLIGMGKSDKPDLDYRFVDHLRYVEGLIEALDLRNVTLVLHDWGGGLGLSYARRHPDNVRGIAFMEAVIKPIDWSDANAVERFMFGRMRDPVKGDRMNLQRAFFLKRVMPMMIRRRLTAEEKAAYMAPYPTPESRKPVAVWPREIPISGEPEDMHREIDANYEWFQTVDLPKLFLHARPGVIFKPSEAAKIRASVEHLESVDVGKGKHYLQEDVPDAIGSALSSWLETTVGLRAGTT